jgi:hypothetical protein
MLEDCWHSLVGVWQVGEWELSKGSALHYLEGEFGCAGSDQTGTAGTDL